jgi:single-strand DNA-binding protein
MSMNTTTIIGRLSNEPEPRWTAGGTAVCELRVAVDDGDKTSFIPVTCYDKDAESAVKYLSKGRRVAVTGKLVNDEWTGSDGERHWRLHVVARRGGIDYLDAPGATPAGRGETQSERPVE